jgi:hypothetical protein
VNGCGEHFGWADVAYAADTATFSLPYTCIVMPFMMYACVSADLHGI